MGTMLLVITPVRGARSYRSCDFVILTWVGLCGYDRNHAAFLVCVDDGRSSPDFEEDLGKVLDK